MIIVSMLPAQMLPGTAASSGGSGLDVAVEGLRSAQGELKLCVTRAPARFPDCQDDPSALRASVPASAPQLHFDGVAPGSYAIAVIHDENGNRRLDRRFGIPTEGVGFSRNPALRFGPPSFAAASFAVGTAHRREQVRMKYFL